jgi:YebC/PmpR family DNA-binding regulatory protein
MSGHNKWSKVKHIKARVDATTGKVFSKLGHEIFIASRDGGGDPGMNPRLRTAIDMAKAQSMPKDNIERAIKKGTGELEGDTIEEAVYEGFGPAGVGFIVEIATDNKNRSAADIRHAFSRHNGNMGTSGSVTHGFSPKGEIRIPADAANEEQMLEHALEAGAEDVSLDEDEHVIISAPEDLNSVASQLREKELTVASQGLVQVPQNTIELTEAGVASQVLRLYEALDDYADTLNVFANFDIPDNVMEKLSADANHG